MLPGALFSIGPFSVHMYGVMIAIGLLACFLVLWYYSKKKNIDPSFVDFVFYDGIAAIVLGFGGGMLFQAFYNYLEHPENGFRFGSGMTFIGGLIAGAAVFLIGYFAFRKKLKGLLVDILSILPCCILVAHGFGRIGCFFAGCCYGVETDSFLGVKFPGLPNPVHPTQLYEAAFLFIMFGICSYLVLKKDFQYNLPLYLASYGVFRFLIEFLRGDDRGAFVGVLSPSQFWSIGMILMAVAVYFGLRYFLGKRKEELKK